MEAALFSLVGEHERGLHHQRKREKCLDGGFVWCARAVGAFKCELLSEFEGAVNCFALVAPCVESNPVGVVFLGADVPRVWEPRERSSVVAHCE